MRDKGAFRAKLNARTVKAAVFERLCAIPVLQRYLNYYREEEPFENAAEAGSLRVLRLMPVRDRGVRFTPGELRDVMMLGEREAEEIALTFKLARIRDLTVLGSSGVSISNRTGRVLTFGPVAPSRNRNWVVARPLRETAGDESAVYVNLLWIRRGHRHFAHFFWDMLVPLMVYLKNWHDSSDTVVCLVREDLSPIQRDAFRFIEADWPGVSFRTLRANEKIRCRNGIFIAFENRNHGKDNALAHDALRDIGRMFLRHYGIDRPGDAGSRKVFVSRADARIRRLKNEDQVAEMLAGLGFERHQPGLMPFPDQAALFRSADWIVSPHGAALANLMFCRPGTRILEIFPENFVDEGFLKLATAMDLDYNYIIAGPGDRSQDFTLDPSGLAGMLEALGASDAIRPDNRSGSAARLRAANSKLALRGADP